jgi:hypothetical protein
MPPRFVLAHTAKVAPFSFEERYDRDDAGETGASDLVAPAKFSTLARAGVWRRASGGEREGEEAACHAQTGRK